MHNIIINYNLDFMKITLSKRFFPGTELFSLSSALGKHIYY